MLAISFVFLLKRRVTSYEIVLGVGALAFLASYVVQMKGWSYHGYPFFTLFFVFACLSAALAASNDAASKLRRGLILVVVSIFLHPSDSACTPVVRDVQQEIGPERLQDWTGGASDRAVCGRANRLCIFDATVSRFPHDSLHIGKVGWAIQFAICCSGACTALGSGQPLTPELQEAEAYLRQAVYEDFQTNKPQLVLIDAATERQFIGSIPFDDIGFYSQDPRFARIWNEYKEVERIGQFRVFIRRHEPREDGDSS